MRDKKETIGKVRLGGNEAMSKHTMAVILILAVLLIIFTPLFLLREAAFIGSDYIGSQVVQEVMGPEFEPWATPLIETIIGGELPHEIETFLFCVQTGIGAGVLAYCFGYLAARKKYGWKSESKE